MAAGVLARPGALHDALSANAIVQLDGATWRTLDDPTARSAGTIMIPVDDILIAVADDEPGAPVHAAWHHVRLDSGPYTLEGDLATMPGFDPGRSLSRPSGEFVMLRDVRLSLRDRPETGISVGDHALVNRYAVERIDADLMLGFFFPGAVIATNSTVTAGAATAQPVGQPG